MKYYYALFKKTPGAIEVEFPDLKGCVTFGDDWEDALIQASDVLAGWLAHAEAKFLQAPSTHSQLEQLLQGTGELVPIAVDEKNIESYRRLKRFNVIFPEQMIHRIDSFRKKVGMKRSTFLQKAAEEYLAQH